jgi:hypothetical protein
VHERAQCSPRNEILADARQRARRCPSAAQIIKIRLSNLNPGPEAAPRLADDVVDDLLGGADGGGDRLGDHARHISQKLATCKQRNCQFSSMLKTACMLPAWPDHPQRCLFIMDQRHC